MNRVKAKSPVKPVVSNGMIQKPKKKMHPYLYFVKENRARIGLENPGKSFKELMGLISEMWAVCPLEEKAKYE